MGFIFLAAVVLAAVPALADTYTFTTCGATGRTGPDQAACNTAYAGTPLEGQVTVSGGIQQWTVPSDGIYRITATGAAGGTQVYAPGYPGGRGAMLQGDFQFSAGQTLYIIVGQMGGDTRVAAGDGGDIDNAGPGGGGGSFVFFDVNDAYPLMAAGGGGSGARCSSVPGTNDASTGTAGNRSGAESNGGSGGNGGLNNASGSDYWGGGGAGWLTDGTGGQNSTDYNYTPGSSDGAEGGRAPRNGAFGGTRMTDGYDEGGDGGFGGGGGGTSDNGGGGAGGGFSGGGGASASGCGNEPGGGGGSYNGGSNQAAVAGVGTGAGSVTIAPPRSIPVLSETGLLVAMLLLAMAGFVAAKRF